MKSVQRKFGTFVKRSENEADVVTVLTEFKAVDDMLERVRPLSHSIGRTNAHTNPPQLIKDLKAWRNAWEDILKLQYDASEAFAQLYKPLEPPPDPEICRHQPAQTPAKYMQKCLGLQKEYSDTKNELAHEIEQITTKLLAPAEHAKQYTKTLHKTLKHRENMKLDYERYLNNAQAVRKKETRTAREETALQAHEAKLAQAQIDYQTADEHVKQTIPPVSAAVLSLLPHLLASQVMLQTTLVGQLYTVLDAYTRNFGFPNPAPPDAQIVSAWDNEFTSLRKELESGIQVVARGKTVHLSMTLPPEKNGSTLTGLGIRNKVMSRKDGKAIPIPHRTSEGSQAQLEQGEPGEPAPPKPPRPGGGGMPSPNINFASKPRISSAPATASNGTYGQPPPPYPTSLTPGYLSDQQSYGGATPPSRYQTPSPIPSSYGGDYFNTNNTTNQQPRRPSHASSIASEASSIAKAKKKPPPVPTKRMPSQLHQYVTALFEFEGQNAGDLSFREGDRIRVVKRTESTDDWWDGELNGRVGAFPANYVQLS